MYGIHHKIHVHMYVTSRLFHESGTVQMLQNDLINCFHWMKERHSMLNNNRQIVVF